MRRRKVGRYPARYRSPHCRTETIERTGTNGAVAMADVDHVIEQMVGRMILKRLMNRSVKKPGEKTVPQIFPRW